MELYLKSLIETLEAEYEFCIYNITPAQRGFFGETWKIVTDQGAFFVKIDYWKYHQESYRKSLFTVAYMKACGVHCIPELLLTKDGCVYCEYQEGLVSVSEYIEGENREDYPLQDLFEKLAEIYKLESQDLDLEIEDFTIKVYDQYVELKNQLNISDSICEILDNNIKLIETYRQSLQWISENITYDVDAFCLTHGDAGGNCIISEFDFHIIDWDSVKIAPIERDVWFFICDEKNIELIERILLYNGISYKINELYLCYYCYYSFIYYITEYLRSYIETKDPVRKEMLEKGLREYFINGWIFNQLQKADQIMEKYQGR